jgi:hypothetical protein
MNQPSRNTVALTLILVTAARLPARAAERALDPARFFANAQVQSTMPAAFALQSVSDARSASREIPGEHGHGSAVAVRSSFPALEAVARVAPAQRAALVNAIRGDAELTAAVAEFPALGWARQRAVLERVMALECQVMGATPPPLVVHGEDEIGPGPAYFEFDADAGGTGIVHLWPRELAAEESEYAALLLTIHETRHSWQFQLAFGAGGQSEPVLAAAFAAGFRAQKALGRKLSFCDFCTMHHEHEAFQTGNQVVGELTGWTASTTGMGCWSSQFDAQGKPLIDLLALAREVGAERLLEAFNEREKGQFVELGGQP